MLGMTYQDVLAEMRANYHPVGPIEEALVRRIARCNWRLRLFEVQEDHIIDRRGVASSVGSTRHELMRTERLVDIQLHRAVEALTKLKETERRNIRSELRKARLSRSLYAPLPHEFAPPKNELAGATEPRASLVQESPAPASD